jgi:SAM-dependent methyltransferase
LIGPDGADGTGRTTSPSSTRFVPAAGRRGLTPLYDAVLAVTMRERRWRDPLVALIASELPRGGRVVDIGAGTGSLAIALARARPDAEVVAIDGDADVLRRARRKPAAERVRWQVGLAGAVPVPDAGGDAVVMSLLLHHLDLDTKRRALGDVRRVLRPRGRLYIADWGRAHDPLMRGAFLALQLIDGFAGTRDHAAGRLPRLIAEAGFGSVRRHARVRTAWGSLEVLSAAPAVSP